MKVFGRDPALWIGLVAVLVQALVAWGVDLTEWQQAGINAVATAAMGLLIAASVARDQIAPAAVGLIGAVGQLAVAFGASLSQEQITTAGAFVTAALAFFVRTQVTAPVSPDGTPVPRKTPLGAPGE